MKELIRKEYQCEKCGSIFDTKTECKVCERKKIQLARFKKGQKVKVTTSDGVKTGKISKIWYSDKNYMHYFAKQYHHTAIYDIKLEDGYSVTQTEDKIQPI